MIDIGQFVSMVQAKAVKAGFRLDEVYGVSGVVIGYTLTKTFKHIHDVNGLLDMVIRHDRRRND